MPHGIKRFASCSVMGAMLAGIRFLFKSCVRRLASTSMASWTMRSNLYE
jgi:hypothetical protein